MKRIAASLIVLAATFPAHALNFTGEMYVVGSVGHMSIDQTAYSNTVNGNSTTTNGVTTTLTNLHSTRDTSQTGYKLQLGYEFSPHFSVEGGFIDLGKTTDSATYNSTTKSQCFGIITCNGLGPSGKVTRTKNISGWSIAGVGVLPVNPDFSLFAKLGLIDAKVNYSATGNGPFTTASMLKGTSESNWKGYYGVGVIYYPNRDHDLGIRAEYERFSKIGDINVSGSTSVDLVSLGVSSKF